MKTKKLQRVQLGFALAMLLLLLGAAFISTAQAPTQPPLTATAQAFDDYRSTLWVERQVAQDNAPVIYRLHLDIEHIPYVDVRFLSIEDAQRYLQTVASGRTWFTGAGGQPLMVNFDYVIAVEPR